MWGSDAAYRQSEIDRKISQVGHWFEWPEENSSQTVSLWEICRATFARFTTEIEVRNIRVRLSNDLEGVTYPRTSARLILDIASEVMMNHLKHAGGSSTSMRVTIQVVEGKRSIDFSSSCLGGEKNEVRTVLGERHNSQIEHLLASTGSGLKRIAGAYATALGKQLQIAAASRKGFFHVLLPIDEKWRDWLKFNILILEDNDIKFNDVQSVVQDEIGAEAQISRASTMVEAERMLFLKPWNLFILDISMDITAGSRSGSSLPQATLGGLSFAKLICIEGLEAPVVLVTAFDSFSDKPLGKAESIVNDLHYVKASAIESLGSYYRGTVRYGKGKWSEEFKLILRGAV